MRDILVLTSRPDTYDSIAACLPPESHVLRAHDLKTAEKMHCQNPFDMVMADIELLESEKISSGFSFSRHPFLKANPFVQFVVLCERPQMKQAIRAVKEGAAGYLLSPVQEKDLQLLLLSADRARSVDFELGYLRDHFWKTEWLDVIRSRTPRMKTIFESIRSVAPTTATVLLLGETGTGKSTLARLIHWHSRRYEKPFIAIHCGAIPETLIESELFGHEKGAFTGAERKKPGRFEMAEGGTIFLDEIGTITPSAQIKLLQILQDGSFTRIGGSTVFRADVRIITATNADLEEQVKKGEFRKDLYYRLNIFPIEVPPLKERLEDFEVLIQVFLEKLNLKYGKGIQAVDESVLEGFRHYDWPGNIRELENILERAYILEHTRVLTPASFPLETIACADARPEDPGSVGGASSISGLSGMTLAQARQHAVDAFEVTYLKALLESSGGRINLAARTADITPRQLNRLLTRHRLDKNDYKSRTGR